MSWYLDTLIKIVTKPALFFHEMPHGTWQEDALSFSLVTGWILSFSLTLVFFVNNYVPTGLSLIDGIGGSKLLIALPVLLVMGAVFFIMTLLIVGGILIAAIISMFMGLGIVLNFLLMLLGGSGNMMDVLKASLYASCGMLAGILIIFMMTAVKYKFASIAAWIMGERIIFYCTSIFLFYLFAEIGTKVHKQPAWKAYLAATVPLILLVLFNVILSSKILPRVAMLLG